MSHSRSASIINLQSHAAITSTDGSLVIIAGHGSGAPFTCTDRLVDTAVPAALYPGVPL